MKSLLEAGVHFGHQTRRWNPNMKRYIFTHRNGIHIIDLQKTLILLEDACRSIVGIIADGGDVLFVGTKKQAQDAVQSEAARCGMPYVNQRWLGGTLTNFQTIRSRIDYMVKLEERKEKGELQKLTKKESLKLEEELARLHKYFGGIRDMRTLPGALFVIDIEREDICIAEVRRLGIPVAAVVDSNTDPELITFPIPSNDDAIRSIRLMSARMADAVLEGLQHREARLREQQRLLEEEQEEAPPETEPWVSADEFTQTRSNEDASHAEAELPEAPSDGVQDGVAAGQEEAPTESDGELADPIVPNDGEADLDPEEEDGIVGQRPRA